MSAQPAPPANEGAEAVGAGEGDPGVREGDACDEADVLGAVHPARSSAPTASATIPRTLITVSP